MRRLLFVLLPVALLLTPSTPVVAQDDDTHAMLFWLSSDYLHDLAEKRTIRYPIELSMDSRSGVHQLASDCEMHVASENPSQGYSSPPAVVVEPPNACKKRISGMKTSGPIGDAWTSFFDQRVIGKTCTATGYPRIFSEHSQGGGSSGSNADHVLEIHPLLGLECPGSTMNFEPLLKIYSGMRKISDGSAATCVESRKLFVRKSGHRYEFAEEGGKGQNGQCGNFVAVDAMIHRDYIREFDKDSSGKGDHSAIAWVTIGQYGPYPLKIYTYRGTPEDTALADMKAGTLTDLHLRLHGLLTYDYLAILKAVQDGNRAWLDTIDDWKEVRFPLALIVFGKAT